MILTAALSLVLMSSCNREKAIHPTRKSITEAVYASGFVAARNEYKVYALTDGNITAKYHVTGDEVKTGDGLYKVQSEGATAKLAANSSAYRLAQMNRNETSPVMQDLQIKIKNAETVLANDQRTYDRYKNMYEANAISKSEYDKVATNLEVSKNNLQSAREAYNKMKDQLSIEAQNAQALVAASGQDLSNYVLKSLIDGVVYETYKEMGEAVRRNDAVALVGEKNGKYLQLSVDQQDIDKIKVGQEVVIKMDIAMDKVYKAKVSKVYPNMNQNNQSFRVDADFVEDPGLNFIHSSVEANIIINKKDNALVIPVQALRSGSEVLLKSGKKMVKVKTGLQNLEDVEIESGITEQDEVLMAKD
jgi:multidrug resistance efflux pump